MNLAELSDGVLTLGETTHVDFDSSTAQLNFAESQRP